MPPSGKLDTEIEVLNGKVGDEDVNISLYQPPEEIRDLVLSAHKDLIHGDLLLSRPFREFNDKSLIQRTSLDQQDWLAWSPEPSENPDESWMFTGTSNATRNNIISMASHVAQQIIFPNVIAQNDEQQEDVEAANVARGLLEYNFRSHEYSTTFMYAIISGLVNPVTYYKADYVKAHMDILEGTNSNYTKKRVIDDALSGFQHHLLPPDEVLISNPYCFDLERQKCLIHRRRMSYAEARELYGDHPNFVHIQPGTLPQYNSADALFYNMRDPIFDGMVEVSTYYYRQIDLQFDEINRIYMGNTNVGYNPFVHRTNKNKPEYNIAKFGAEPIDAKRFWAYKSVAAKLSNDKELLDRMRQNAVDASTLSTFPPTVTMGAGKMDQAVNKPATVTDLNRDAKIERLPVGNAEAAFSAMRQAQEDIDSASNPSYFSMPSGMGKKSELEMELLQQNAMSNLALIRIMIGGMVTNIGRIILNDSLRYQTVAEIKEIVNDLPILSYKSFNVPKVKNGKSVTDRIIFTDAYLGKSMDEDERKMHQVALLEKYGDDAHVWEVNPDVFIKRDFLVIIEDDALKPRDQANIDKRKSDLYDKAIANPLIARDPEKLAAVTRDFLFEPIVHGDASKYIPDTSTNKVIDSILGKDGGGGNDPSAELSTMGAVKGMPMKV